MSTYWTIAVLGVEKQWADWGVSIDSAISVANRGMGVFNIETTEQFDTGNTQWTFKQHAVVWRDRTSSNGAPGTFSGGTIVFQGYFDDPVRSVDGGEQHVSYKLCSMWWLFQRNSFSQYRNQFIGWDHAHQRVAAANVAVGGANYKVGDILNVTSGTGTAAQLNVIATGAGGAITILNVENNGGVYSTTPTTPATLSGGSGTGAKANLGFSLVPRTQQIVLPEVYLGELLDAPNGVVRQQHSGDQVREVITWMNLTYNPTRRPGFGGGVDPTQDVVAAGLIEPQTFFPVTPVQSTIKCAEAVLQSLRWDPDAIVYEDPTQTPPTLNVRKLGRWNYSTTPPTFLDYTNLPEVVVPITAQQEEKVQVAGRQNRSLPGVMIYYKSVNEIDGTVAPVIVVDRFPDGVTLEPGGGAPLPAITDFIAEVSRHTVTLGGFSLNRVSATVNTTSIAQLISGDPVQQAIWWEAHDKTLQDPLVTNIAPTGVPTIVDDNGNVINTTLYAYELLGTNLPEWLGAPTIRVRVSQQIGFKRFTDATKMVLDHQAAARFHSQTIVLTTVPPNLYSGPGSLAASEEVPQNVAQSVYRAATMPLWAGSIEFTDQQTLRSDITLGVRLRLVGPTTTFFNVLVQSIETIPGRGITRVGYGAEWDTLDVDLWIELARMARMRNNALLPSGRADGGVGANNTQQAGAATPGDNTAHGAGGFSFDSVSFVQVP